MSQIKRSKLTIKRGFTNLPQGTISNIVIQKNGVIRIQADGYKRKGKFHRKPWKN